jgi:hypothetical protein
MEKRILILLFMSLASLVQAQKIPLFPKVKFGIEGFATTGAYLLNKESYTTNIWKPGAGFGFNLWIAPKRRVNLFLQAGYEYQQGAFSYNPEDVFKKQTDSLKVAYQANPTTVPPVPDKVTVLEKSQLVFFHPAVRVNLVNKIFKLYVMAGAKLNYTLGVTTDYDVKENALKTKAKLNTNDFTVDPSGRIGITLRKKIDLSFSYTQKFNPSNPNSTTDKSLVGTHLAFYF